MKRNVKIVGLALLSFAFVACSHLDLDYELSSGQTFANISGAFSNKNSVGYTGYEYYFGSSPEFTSRPWDTSVLHSPAAINGSTHVTQCYVRKDTLQVTLNFYCGGSATTPTKPPEGDYQVSVGSKVYSFHNIHSRQVDSSLDDIFIPEVKLTLTGSSKVTQIEWRWWKKSSGAWAMATASDMASLKNTEYEIGQSDWSGPRVNASMSTSPTGSVVPAAQSFTPGAFRISYMDASGYHYGIEWR